MYMLCIFFCSTNWGCLPPCSRLYKERVWSATAVGWPWHTKEHSEWQLEVQRIRTQPALLSLWHLNPEEPGIDQAWPGPFEGKSSCSTWVQQLPVAAHSALSGQGARHHLLHRRQIHVYAIYVVLCFLSENQAICDDHALPFRCKS